MNTPETDAFQYSNKAHYMAGEFARKLERERDEARGERDRLAAALRECREDSYELLAERDWWKNETRIGYQERYKVTLANTERATEALQSLTTKTL